MKIVIKDNNSDAIQAALDEVNGKAYAFTVNHHTDVEDIAAQAEKRLDEAGIPGSKRGGVKVTFVPAGPAAKSYQFGAQSTRINMVRSKSGTWSLVDVARVKVYPKQAKRLEVTIDSEQADIVRERALAGFRVVEQVAA